MPDIDVKSIFDIEPDEAREARPGAEARADVAAGRVVMPHANARLIRPQSSTACSCPGNIENTI